MIEGLIGGLFNGISIGAVLLIVALGLAIVFGLMGVINLAHGELMMLGAYTTYVVQNGAKAMGDGASEFYIFAALPLSFLVAALVGLALERGVIRYLYGRPLETLLATWGVSLILRQFVRSVNWAMVLGLGLFCVLFFGGRWLLQRQVNWAQMRRVANPVILGLSMAIAIATGLFMNQTGGTTLSRAFSRSRAARSINRQPAGSTTRTLSAWARMLGRWATMTMVAPCALAERSAVISASAPAASRLE